MYLWRLVGTSLRSVQKLQSGVKPIVDIITTSYMVCAWPSIHCSYLAPCTLYAFSHFFAQKSAEQKFWNHMHMNLVIARAHLFHLECVQHCWGDGKGHPNLPSSFLHPPQQVTCNGFVFFVLPPSTAPLGVHSNCQQGVVRRPHRCAIDTNKAWSGAPLRAGGRKCFLGLRPKASTEKDAHACLVRGSSQGIIFGVKPNPETNTLLQPFCKPLLVTPCVRLLEVCRPIPDHICVQLDGPFASAPGTCPLGTTAKNLERPRNKLWFAPAPSHQPFVVGTCPFCGCGRHVRGALV